MEALSADQDLAIDLQSGSNDWSGWTPPTFIVHNDDGEKGEDGVQGEDGEEGEAGKEGEKGKEGEAGKQGLAGSREAAPEALSPAMRKTWQRKAWDG